MNLREKVLRGGFFMVFRTGFGVAIGFLGVIILTRLIGPADYGLYAAAFGVITFCLQLGRMGIDVYLVRRDEAPEPALYHQAFSFLLVCGAALSGATLLASPLIGYWLGDARFLAPLQAMLLLMPLNLLASPALARLEHALDYQRVAMLELVELIMLYAVAVPLAWLGWGVWAPVIGYGASQLWLLLAGLVLARYRPRWHWSWPMLRDMCSYGLSMSASTWLWQLRTLVNPLIIGRFLGPEGVGYVALAIRLVDGLSFVKVATWRLSIAVLAKVQHDQARLRTAMEEAISLQVLILGPLLAGFALVMPWAVPALFGEQWRPVEIVYPFVALGVLVNAAFNMHSAVLYVLKRPKDVALANGTHILLFATAALVFVPQLGLFGWGAAEAIALASYAVIHYKMVRVFTFSYARALPWLVAFIPPLFVSLVGTPAGLLLWLSVLAIPFSWAARTQIDDYWQQVRKFTGELLPGKAA